MNKLCAKITLKSLIVAVIVLAFILSIASSLFSSYQGDIKLSKEHSLETNRVYAQKVSQMVTVYLNDVLKVLEYSAAEIADNMNEEETLMKEAVRLHEQANTFNSVAIVNKEGLILARAPIGSSLKGRKVTSSQELQVIKSQKPTITKPYKTSAGKVMIVISYPIFSTKGEYEGAINGTVYLNDSNFFEAILGKHYYDDGSYVFVVDSEGKIIHHQNRARVGDDVSDNEAVKQIMNGKSGAQTVTSKFGVDMLAGYSLVDKTNWGVIAQTPETVAANSVGKLVITMFLIQLPLIILSIIIAVFAAKKIAKPLESLAAFTEDSVDESEMGKLHHIDAWYYESRQIKTALIQSFTFLHSQVNLFMDKSTIDPLTGVMNRRALDEILQQWIAKEQNFAVIMLDSDHFKNVNDTYGHAMGDEVLKYLAKNMKEVTREQDICCRFGGEEFIILLPETTIQEAYGIAERFRQNLEKTNSPYGRPITLSAGVASFPETASNSADLLEAVDQALYEAKRKGRNRVLVASVQSE